MTTQEFYHTIEQRGTAEFKDRGSRFLAYALPVHSLADFKSALEQVRQEHPKATHHCFAYRLGHDGQQYRVSDDGEPSGTAGRPILGQIDRKKITNILVVVVRYFGGSLLGVPGLIHAYKSAAALVLQTTPIVLKAIEDTFTLQFNYTVMNEVMRILKQCEVNIMEKEVGLYCRFSLRIPRKRKSEVTERLKDLHETILTPVETLA